MLRRAVRYLPALARMTALRSWAGLRPATPDGLPIIGPHPSRPGLWLAVGHEGLGVTTAPATAALVAAGITGAAAPLDPRPYRAERLLATPAAALERTP
jgi:glycine/D-amino acid oxidase-like deaminating enzyme